MNQLIEIIWLIHNKDEPDPRHKITTNMVLI